MLTHEEKKQLRKLSEFKFFHTECNGVVMDDTSKESVHFPDVEEIRSYVFDQIQSLGFTSITMLNSPRKANVILRIYSKKDYRYDNNHIHNLYGHYCFVRHGLSWITTTPRGDIIHRDAQRAPLRVWFFQDEYRDYNCDFTDFYLKIK